MKFAKLFLVLFCLCMLSIPVSADFLNGDFSIGTADGWTGVNLYEFEVHNTFLNLQAGDWYNGQWGYFYQDIDLTGVDEITFNMHYGGGVTSGANAAYRRIEYRVDSDVLGYDTQVGTSRLVTLDVSEYTGVHRFAVYLRYSAADFDNFFAAGAAPPVAWDQESYTAGNLATISYAYPDFNPSNENYINIRSYNPASDVWELEQMLFVVSSSGSIQYIVPSYTSRQFRAELMTRPSVLYEPTVLGTDNMLMVGEGSMVAFESSIYGRNDNVNMTYVNMPEGARIEFRLGKYPYIDFQTWYVSGNGSVSHQLVDAPFSEVLGVVAYDSSGTSLFSDGAYVESPPEGNTHVTGIVHDSITGNPISGALVGVAGEAATTNANGEYEIYFQKGTHTIEVSKAGYVTKSQEFDFTSSYYTYNPYLQPYTGASTTLYGSVSSLETGAVLRDVQVTLWNSDFSKVVYTSQYGNFNIEGLNDGESYYIKASKEWFDPFVDQFTFSSADNVYNIQLNYDNVEDDDERGSTGGIDDGSGESNPDTPTFPDGSTSIRRYLESENFIETLLGVLVILFLMAVMAVMTLLATVGTRRWKR